MTADEHLPVPLIGLSFEQRRAFDPRQSELLAAAQRAGLTVLWRDAVYVYVAGFTFSVCEALRAQHLPFHVTVTLMEERPSKPATRRDLELALDS